MLAVDFMRQGVRRRDELNGSGVVVLNPPYRLHDELGQILPELTGPLGAGPGVGFQQKWLGEP